MESGARVQRTADAVTDDRPVRICVIGVSDYLQRFAFPGLMAADGCRLVGIAVRDEQRARRKLQGSHFEGLIETPYERAFQRDDVDAVYITLPNGLHVEWTLRALEAGKHVLCEKPIAMHPDDLDRVASSAGERGLTVQEGYMYRFHPQWTRLMEIIRSGKIGGVRTVISHCGYIAARREGPRFDPDLGGGALWMVGCYPVNLALLVFDDDPIAVTATARPAGTTGVDAATSAVIEFDAGHAIVTAFVDGFDSQHARVIGEAGAVEVPAPFDVGSDLAVQLVLEVGRAPEMIPIPASDHFRLEFEHFAKVVGGTVEPIVSLRDSHRTTRVLRAIADSANSGGKRIPL